VAIRIERRREAAAPLFPAAQSIRLASGAKRARMPEQDLATRVEELEARYMLLERYLDELSDVVAAQQRTIDVLRATIARLPRTTNVGDAEDAAPDERPPHY
jgi:uncharacterized coiled-coil protein SlyX